MASDPPRADDPALLPTCIPELSLDPARLDEAFVRRDASSEALDEAAFRARYQDGESLGRGGMGEVRLVLDRRIGREVALKVLLGGADTSASSTARFLREARVQGQLEHPSVAPVYDVGVDPAGAAYFTMKRVRGRTLDVALAAVAAGEPDASARFSRRRLLDAFVRMCHAVDYAHARGVVHRDLKPLNVMLGDFGEVHVLDWGLARVRGASATEAPGDARDAGLPITAETSSPPPSSGDAPHTVEGAVLGTPGYMSPEQAAGRNGEVDARADVYALGAVLFEILTGAALHPGRRAVERIATTLAPGAVSPAARRPELDIAPELDAACARALAFSPDERFAAAGPLGAAVERYLDGDRDVARRRELAAEHAARARALTASLAGRSGAEADEARAEAMREATRALALDPKGAEAAALLAAMLLEVPEEVPAAARAELDRERAPLRRAAARLVVLRAFGVVAMVGALSVMGVRRWDLLGLILGSLVVAGAATAWWWRAHEGAPGRPSHWLAMGASAVSIVGLGSLLGPLLLLPTLAMANALLFGAQMDFRRRDALLALNLGPVALALALQRGAVLPGGVEVLRDRVVIHAGLTSYAPALVWFVLSVAAAMTVALPVVLLARLRAQSDALERRLFMHSWHLRNLVARPPP